MPAIIGRKLGMTQIFDEAGLVVPVTVIEAGPCPVVQVRTAERDGYSAVQLGFGAQKDVRVNNAEKGHATKAGLEAAPAVLKEFRFEENAPEVGGTVTVEGFERGGRVKVTGVTKGRGFQGVVKRWGFGGGANTHGNTKHRKPGSIGPGTDPSRVIKGKKMPGHYGAERHTQAGLRVERIDAERNLIYIRGSVAGPTNGIVLVRKQG